MSKKTIFHLHSGEFGSFCEGARGIRHSVIQHFVSKANIAITVSRSTGAELSTYRCDVEPPHIIGNAARDVEIDANPVIDRCLSFRPYIAFVGKLTILKGVEDLFVALAILKRQGYDVELRLAGDGDIAYWRERAVEHDIVDRVKFMGWLEGTEKYEFLRNAYLFCMPSHFESFGISTLEAMHVGVAVVGTRLGGFLDLVVDGETGFLVAPRSPDELADRLRTLISDRELATRMGSAGLALARRSYSSDVIIGQYINVYRQFDVSRKRQDN